MRQDKAEHKEERGTLAVRLFGGVEVLLNGEPLPRLRSRKSLWLLVLLILRGDKLTERDWLIERLWPEPEDERFDWDARNSLRVSLADLRKTLGTQSWRLTSPTTGALMFDLTKADIDVMVFDVAIGRGDPPSLETAVRLYRGPLLDGIAENWADQERAGRELACRKALEELATRALASGDYPQAIDWLRRSCALDSLRAEPVRRLMRALDHVGRTEEALCLFREFQKSLLHTRWQLDDEIRLLYQTLVQKASSVALRSTLPEWTPRDPVPTLLTELIGRQTEIPEILVRLRSHRLVTLLGSGGVGKTTLALALASQAETEFGIPVCFVRLEALTDPWLVPASVRTALGIGEDLGHAEDETLRRFLRDRPLLLVLDNCEHLLPACASLIETLLPACPRLTILATSRQPFGLAYESRLRVDSLAVPAPDSLPEDGSAVAIAWKYSAVRLFVERAHVARDSFQLTLENVRLIAQLCRRLDGIPLALEIAAASTRFLSLAQIAERLERQFDCLPNACVLTLPRHQTLGAVIAWSYERLSEPEQRLLAQLSVFLGGWTLEAAEAVCTDEIVSQNIVGLLAALTDKSLVVYDESQDGEGRFRLLETIRQYVLPCLGAMREPCRRRHRDWFLALGKSAEAQLYQQAQKEWLARLTREQDNLRAALDFCAEMPEEVEQSLSLAAALTRFWRMRGTLSEGRARLTGLLALPGAQCPTQARAEALNGAGTLARMQGDLTVARMCHQESLVLMQAMDDRAGMARALHNLGNLAVDEMDFLQARHFYTESLAQASAVRDQEAIANSLACLGNVALVLEEIDEAQSFLAQSLALRESLGNAAGMANTLIILADLYWRQGNAVLALQTLYQGLMLVFSVGDQELLVYGLESALRYAYGQARWERAAYLSGAVQRIREQSGFAPGPAREWEFSQTRLGLQQKIGEAAFAAAAGAGRVLTVEQMMEYVLSDR